MRDRLLTPFSVQADSLEIAWPMIVQGMMVSVALGLIGCFLVVCLLAIRWIFRSGYKLRN